MSQSKLLNWLQRLGFKANPFVPAEADQERRLLSEFFIEIDGYDRIESDQTLAVFAPDGGGKTTLRVMLASQAAPMTPGATRLAVECTDVESLIQHHRQAQGLDIDHYVHWLLRAAIWALFKALCTSQPPTLPRDLPVSQHTPGLQRLSPPNRARLVSLIRRYCPGLLSPAILYERLQALAPTFQPTWSEFCTMLSQRQLGPLIAGEQALANSGTVQLLVDLQEYPDMSVLDAVTSTEWLQAFVDIAHAMGFTAVVFLIDGVNEISPAASDPALQADLLEPLLAHTLLMRLSGVGFKFFLPLELRETLQKRPAIRRSGILDHSIIVKWDKHQLDHLLNERLKAYSDSQVHDLVELCENTPVKRSQKGASKRFGREIVTQLLTLVQPTPRLLLTAIELLCEAHVARSGTDGLINQSDWEAAEPEIRRLLPMPILRLQLQDELAYVGHREVKLTRKEYTFLRTLARAEQSICDRDTLLNAVWDKPDATDHRIDKLVERLREKLGDDARYPVYLHTKKGKGVDSGFRLEHYSLE